MYSAEFNLNVLLHSDVAQNQVSQQSSAQCCRSAAAATLYFSTPQQHILKRFQVDSIAAVKHSNARSLGMFSRWSQCMSHRRAVAGFYLQAQSSTLISCIAQVVWCHPGMHVTVVTQTRHCKISPVDTAYMRLLQAWLVCFLECIWLLGDHLRFRNAWDWQQLECMRLTATWKCTWSENAPKTAQILKLQKLFTGDVLGISFDTIAIHWVVRQMCCIETWFNSLHFEGNAWRDDHRLEMHRKAYLRLTGTDT